MKKSLLLLWIVVLILSISMFAAFSEVAAAEKSPLPSGHLVIWSWVPNDVYMDAALEGFKDLYPDISWEYVNFASDEIYVKLPLAITAGKGAPDICLVENSHLQQIIRLGGILDITDRLQPYISNLAAYKVFDGQLDGKYYAVPMDSAPVVMYYRRDVFKKAGLASDPDSVADMVSTWDKYYETAKTIKAKTGQFMQPVSKASNSGRLFEEFLWSQGLGYVDADGKVVVNSPEAVATLEFIGKMSKEGLFSDEPRWTAEWINALGNKDKSDASLIEASWMTHSIKSECSDSSGLWGVAPMPASKEGGARASVNGGSAFVISDQCKNPEAAWALLQYTLLTDKGVIDIFKAGDYTPSLLSTYSSDVFDTEDPFFANQVLGKLFNEINAKIPVAYIYSSNYSEMNSLTAPEISKYLIGKQTAQEALDNAAAAIKAATGRQ